MSNDLEDGSPIFAAASHTNIGKVDTQGIEIFLKYFISQHWTADFNYAWFDFTVKEELTENPILVNAPEHRFNLGAAYGSDLLDVSMRYRWVDDFLWSEGFFNGVVESYSTIDLTANIYFGCGFSFGINVTNLLNNKHYQMFGGDIIRRNAVATVSYRWQ